MLITNLLYFTLSGLVGLVGTPDDPYYLHPGQSDVGNQLFGASKVGIRWTYNDKITVEKRFHKSARVALDPSSKYVVAIVYGDPNYPSLKNALVFNADGSLHGSIEPPPYIRQQIGKYEYKNFEPENFSSVKIKNGMLLIGIDFNHEWYENRFYDVKTNEWGEVFSSGRY